MREIIAGRNKAGTSMSGMDVEKVATDALQMLGKKMTYIVGRSNRIITAITKFMSRKQQVRIGAAIIGEKQKPAGQFFRHVNRFFNSSALLL